MFECGCIHRDKETRTYAVQHCVIKTQQDCARISEEGLATHPDIQVRPLLQLGRAHSLDRLQPETHGQYSGIQHDGTTIPSAPKTCRLLTGNQRSRNSVVGRVAAGLTTSLRLRRRQISFSQEELPPHEASSKRNRQAGNNSHTHRNMLSKSLSRWLQRRMAGKAVRNAEPSSGKTVSEKGPAVCLFGD